MRLSEWVAEVNRPDPRVRAYLGNIYEADPDLPQNRDQNIQHYRWDIEANNWRNNLGDHPTPTEHSQTLSFLVVRANALDVTTARARWDEEVDEPILVQPDG